LQDPLERRSELNHAAFAALRFGLAHHECFFSKSICDMRSMADLVTPYARSERHSHHCAKERGMAFDRRVNDPFLFFARQSPSDIAGFLQRPDTFKTHLHRLREHGDPNVHGAVGDTFGLVRRHLGENLGREIDGQGVPQALRESKAAFPAARLSTLRSFGYER
jgi:hypothetical protein